MSRRPFLRSSPEAGGRSGGDPEVPGGASRHSERCNGSCRSRRWVTVTGTLVGNRLRGCSRRNPLALSMRQRSSPFERDNRTYFAKSISDRGDSFFQQFSEQVFENCWPNRRPEPAPSSYSLTETVRWWAASTSITTSRMGRQWSAIELPSEYPAKVWRPPE